MVAVLVKVQGTYAIGKRAACLDDSSSFVSYSFKGVETNVSAEVVFLDDITVKVGGDV